jgi:uncharacterized protein YaaR (DUF327 family)
MSMKVQGVKGADRGIYPAPGTGTHGVRAGDTHVFRRTLTELSKEVHIARLEGLKRGIDEQGALLADKVDVKDYEKYRRLIREFFEEIVSNGYDFSREDAYAHRGRHRYIATVRIVDEKLDELGKEVLKEQADKLEILGRIDDIRGLLLDLLM